MTTEMPGSDKTRAIALWTGGKDCNLALYEAPDTGFEVVALLTFAPAQPAFRAHPIAVMEAQARALGIQHEVMTVTEPYAAGYRNAIIDACSRHDASTLITGDIDAVDGLPNWVRQCCKGTHVEVVMPLWDQPREALLRRFIDLGFEAVFSCVKAPLGPDWLGRPLDASALQDLLALQRTQGIDPSGEQGEYHTLVLDGPGFERRLRLQTAGHGHQDGLTYLQIGSVEIERK